MEYKNCPQQCPFSVKYKSNAMRSCCLYDLGMAAGTLSLFTHFHLSCHWFINYSSPEAICYFYLLSQKPLTFVLQSPETRRLRAFLGVSILSGRPHNLSLAVWSRDITKKRFGNFGPLIIWLALRVLNTAWAFIIKDVSVFVSVNVIFLGQLLCSLVWNDNWVSRLSWQHLWCDYQSLFSEE